MLNFLNIGTFLWLTFWALRAFKDLASGEQNSILFVILVHFLFSGFPLLLDVVAGQPEYSIFPGFYTASRDNTTSIIYCLYVSAIPPFWWWTGRVKQNLDASSFNITPNTASLLRRIYPTLNLMFFILLISPLLAWMYSPEPYAYFDYGTAVKDTFRFETGAKYHSDYMTSACFLSLIGATGILALKRKIDILTTVFLLPWLMLTFWLSGKRYIIVFAIVLLGYVFWQKGYLRGFRFIVGILLGVLIVLTLSYIYQAQVRDVSTDSIDPVEYYDGIRVDYGRDAEIKMAIYAELHPEKLQILEYRGQSILFYLTIFVPRSLWPEKPLTYAQYATSAALNQPPTLLGWGITTSWLEEAIANFSWFGMILGPLVPTIICRVGDSRKNAFISPLTVMVASLLLAVELVAFFSLFLFWFVGIILIQPDRKIKLYEFESKQSLVKKVNK